MSILDTKRGVSAFFFQNWTETPIHWFGLEFDINGLDEWIFVSYTHTSSKNADINGSDYRENGVIDILIYARTENRTFEIYDMISNMLRNQRIGNTSVDLISIDNKATMSTENGDYRVLDIGVYLKSF